MVTTSNGERTHATLSGSARACPSPTGVGNLLNPACDGDWGLQLFPINKEFPVEIKLSSRDEKESCSLDFEISHSENRAELLFS